MDLMFMFDPQQVAPWPWIAASLLLLAAIARVAWTFRLWHLGYAKQQLLVALFCGLAAAGLLALAAWNPVLLRVPRDDAAHMVVLLDVSDSVMYARQNWPAMRDGLVEWFEKSLGAATPDVRDSLTASILTFGAGQPVVGAQAAPLRDLTRALKRLDPVSSPSRFASGNGTDIAAGLTAAGQAIGNNGGRGAVLLVSDGNETSGDARQAAHELARQGIPVHVYPIAGQGPSAGIVAGNLPSRVTSGEETRVRLVLRNTSPTPAVGSLIIRQNGGVAAAGGSESVTRIDMAPDEWQPVYATLRFGGRGMQFVDVSLVVDGEPQPHNRRFYTQVVEPAHLLVIGGDLGWLEVLGADFAAITTAGPEFLTADTPLADYDGLIISGVAATQFLPGTLAVVRRAVEDDGMGLLVINGSHIGSDEAATILGSFQGTPLDGLLPLNARPRDFQKEPPPRKIVILVDTSGSMDGDNLEQAKEIIRHIAGDLMRDNDRLDLLSFTVGSAHLIRGVQMDRAGQAEMRTAVDSLVASGGTDPSVALATISQLDLSAGTSGLNTSGDCALIFISDLGFNPTSQRPECRSTVFAIGHESIPAGSPLQEFADPIPVPLNFDPDDITIPYFEPEKRTKSWEPGAFKMLTPGRMLVQPLPLPATPIDGAAITHLEPDAELHAVRPRFADPLLAYREAGGGYVGAFATAIPAAWASDAEAAGAVTAWVERILPFQALDRYDLLLEERSGQLALHLMVSGDGTRIPRVDAIDLTVDLSGIEDVAVALKPDPQERAAFIGAVQLPALEQPLRGHLVVREHGPDQLARPQRLPILLGPALATRAITSEAYTYGLDEGLLRDIAVAGGGQFSPPADAALLHSRMAAAPPMSLWPWFVAAAMLAYLGAILAQRWVT